MSDDSNQVWSDVGEQFRKLGAGLRRHYESSTATGSATESLRAIADEVGRACAALGDAVRDKTLQDDAKRAAQAFAEALAKTVDDATDQIRDRIAPKREDT